MLVVATSLNPNGNKPRQRECIASWQKAGGTVYAFHSRDEMIRMDQKDWPGIMFREIEANQYAPVSTVVKMAAVYGDTVMIVNSDCELLLSEEDLAQMMQDTSEGLLYLVRHDQTSNQITRATHGIDAFFIPSDLACIVPDSKILCLGKPWWDWVLPLSFLHKGKKLYAPETKVLLHKQHKQNWGSEDYLRCKTEACKILNWPEIDAMRMIQEIRNNTKRIGPAAPPSEDMIIASRRLLGLL